MFNGLLFVTRIFRSLGTEMKIIAMAMASLILLPAAGIVVLANAPLQAVSDVIAWVNPQTHKIEYRDSGGAVHELQITTTWPTKGSISLEFGASDLPYQTSHTGIDIAANTGTPIVAAIGGTVTYAGEDTTKSLSIGIASDDGITSYYAHASRLNVKKGDKVEVGALIGEVGQTGWATGPHLHYEVRMGGILVNPRTILPESTAP